jgi:hypothetical protein|tara:strand:- start:6462 stop:7040 length:579 start_codon:yes stop_codon:yes gene_type:complete
MSRYWLNSSRISGFAKNDLIFIVKTTRGRHSLPKAEKGNNYLVLSFYTNQMGTTKYVVLGKNGKEYFTTEKSAEKVEDFTFKTSTVWSRAKRLWMDETYVPVFGVHTYDYVGMPYVSSRDGKSRLIKPLGKSIVNGTWINKEFVHDDDVKLFLSSSFAPDATKKGQASEAVTFRIPLWIAEKNGFFSDDKSK